MYEDKPEKQEFEDESVYTEEVRDGMVDDDEMSPEEDGFMDGYEEQGLGKKPPKKSDEPVVSEEGEPATIEDSLDEE